MIRAVDQCHAMLRERVRPGDVVVDATAGNGNDTLFLARLVGAEGRVYAFDVQACALEATRRRLVEAGVQPGRVRLIHAGHETMAAAVGAEHHGHVAAVVLNLGYLPGGDKTLVTRPETTRVALEAAWALLRPGGLITAVAYTGHAGGREEAEAVRGWVEARKSQGGSFQEAAIHPQGPALLSLHKETPREGWGSAVRP